MAGLLAVIAFGLALVIAAHHQTRFLYELMPAHLWGAIGWIDRMLVKFIVPAVSNTTFLLVFTLAIAAWYMAARRFRRPDPFSQSLLMERGGRRRPADHL